MRRFFSLIWEPAFLLAGAVIYAILRLVEPLLWIRISALHHDRLGNFLGTTELFLRRLVSGGEDPKALYFFY